MDRHQNPLSCVTRAYIFLTLQSTPNGYFDSVGRAVVFLTLIGALTTRPFHHTRRASCCVAVTTLKALNGFAVAEWHICSVNRPHSQIAATQATLRWREPVSPFQSTRCSLPSFAVTAVLQLSRTRFSIITLDYYNSRPPSCRSLHHSIVIVVVISIGVLPLGRSSASLDAQHQHHTTSLRFSARISVTRRRRPPSRSVVRHSSSQNRLSSSSSGSSASISHSTADRLSPRGRSTRYCTTPLVGLLHAVVGLSPLSIRITPHFSDFQIASYHSPLASFRKRTRSAHPSRAVRAR